MNDPLSLTIATRVYTAKKFTGAPTRSIPPPPPLPRQIGERCLIFDCETRDEPGQRLLFASYQLRDFGELVPGGVGLVVGDACPARGRRILEKYATVHGLELKTRDAFADLFLAEVWEIGTTSVTFNAPFDHAKISCNWTPGEGRNKDAFHFQLSRDTYKPRLRIQSLDSLKQFMQLVSSVRGQSKRGWHPGYFIDARTLIAALTEEGMSLERACEFYKVPTQKRPAVRHGVVSKGYIEYNLDDVQSTYEVYQAAMRDYDRLGI